jgi:GNAT superfamily N-acetyltransferase
MIIIRYAAPHDVEEIASLWERMVKELKPEYAPNAGWWVGMAKALLNTEAYHAVTAVDDQTGRIIGFLDGFIYPNPLTGAIHGVGQHFYVLPEYRKTPVAARLYREALKKAKAKGSKIIEFLTDATTWQRKGYVTQGFMVGRTI